MSESSGLSNRQRRVSKHRPKQIVKFIDTSQDGVTFDIECFCPNAKRHDKFGRVFYVGSSSYSHPAYIKGKKVFVDTDKRIDAFNKRYGNLGII